MSLGFSFIPFQSHSIFFVHVAHKETIIQHSASLARLLQQLLLQTGRTGYLDAIFKAFREEVTVLTVRHGMFIYLWLMSRHFGTKRDEVTSEWRKLHNRELHDFYPSPSIIRIIMSRRMRWAGHVARMG
jgi:hypothetical protein